MTKRWMKPALLGAVVLGTLGLTLADQLRGMGGLPVPSGLVGKPAPEVTFTLLDGGVLPLRSLVGKPVLLHFWASWCAPCREEFDGLLRLMQARPGSVLLAVSGDENPDDAKRFVAPYRQRYAALFEDGRVRVAVDPSRTLIGGVFGTFAYPETIEIDAGGVILRKVVGPLKKADLAP